MSNATMRRDLLRALERLRDAEADYEEQVQNLANAQQQHDRALARVAERRAAYVAALDALYGDEHPA